MLFYHGDPAIFFFLNRYSSNCCKFFIHFPSSEKADFDICATDLVASMEKHFQRSSFCLPKVLLTVTCFFDLSWVLKICLSLIQMCVLLLLMAVKEKKIVAFLNRHLEFFQFFIL